MTFPGSRCVSPSQCGTIATYAIIDMAPVDRTFNQMSVKKIFFLQKMFATEDRIRMPVSLCLASYELVLAVNKGKGSIAEKQSSGRPEI